MHVSANIVQIIKLMYLLYAQPSIWLWGFSGSTVQWQQEYTYIQIQTRAYVHEINQTHK